MLPRESDVSTPWMSALSRSTSDDYTSLPRCAVLSFHRDGDVVHWTPLRSSPPSSTDEYSPELDHLFNDTVPEAPVLEDVERVIDLSSVLEIAAKHGMTAPLPPPLRRRFGWTKNKHKPVHTQPESTQPLLSRMTCSAPPSHSVKLSKFVKTPLSAPLILYRTSAKNNVCERTEISEYAWVGPTRAPEVSTLPRLDSPKTYRDFRPSSSPLDLALVAQNGRRPNCLDSPGISLGSSNRHGVRAHSTMSDSMTLQRRSYRSYSFDKPRQPRRKKMYRRIRSFFCSSPTSKHSQRTRTEMKTKTSENVYFDNLCESNTRRASADIYMQFMSD